MARTSDGTVQRYRIMAIISGVMSLLLWFVYVPIKAFGHDPIFIANWSGYQSHTDTSIRFTFSPLSNSRSKRSGHCRRWWALFSRGPCRLLP